MKKALIILFLVSASVVNAQQYSTAIGLRLGGYNSGISVKHFIGSANALEGLITFGRSAFRITGLYEHHTAFPNAEGLSWYYGAGVHVGFYTNDYGYSYWRYYKNKGTYIFINDDYRDSNISIGGDFILGLEYKFKNAPINLGLDVKPFIDFVPGFFGYWEGALSVRFTL